MNRKTMLSTAIGVVIGGVSLGAQANLTSSATLSFSLGTTQVIACSYGTPPPCVHGGYNVTDIVGSYFAVDITGDGVFKPDEKAPISSLNGIHIGTVQAASGSHSGAIDGTENPNIDNPWEYFGVTGMHQTTSPVTVTSVTANGAILDMSGWSWDWNSLSIPMAQQGAATMTCTAGSSCSDTSSYTLDAAFQMDGAGVTTYPYVLHLEGTVSSPVPLPATAWLFGSGLVGLVGVARRRKGR